MARTHRLHLRFRLMAAFGGGALLLALAVAFLAYGLTRTYLLKQRATSTLRQAQVNARLVATALRSTPDVPQLLGSLPSPGGSSSVVFHDGRWFAASLAFGRDALPAELRKVVTEQRNRARQRYVHDDIPRLAVGLPLGQHDAYFEVRRVRGGAPFGEAVAPFRARRPLRLRRHPPPPAGVGRHRRRLG